MSLTKLLNHNLNFIMCFLNDRVLRFSNRMCFHKVARSKARIDNEIPSNTRTVNPPAGTNTVTGASTAATRMDEFLARTRGI